MNLEQMAKKCRQTIALRSRIAGRIMKLRKENVVLHKTVREQSRSHLLAVMHGMRADLEGYRQLQARIVTVEEAFLKREDAMRGRENEIQKVVKSAVEHATTDLRQTVRVLHRERTEAKIAHSQQLRQLSEAEPAWRLANGSAFQYPEYRFIRVQ